MNRTARRHLLAQLELATAPLYVFTPKRLDDREKAMQALDGGRFRFRSQITIPCDMKIISPKPAGVRVVAGKGARRRGVRAT